MLRAVFSALVTATGPTDRTRAHNARVQQVRHNAEKGCAR